MSRWKPLAIRNHWITKAQRTFGPGLMVLLLLVIGGETYASELRIKNVQRCGDLLERKQQEFCLEVSGEINHTLRVKLADKALAAARIERADKQLRITLSTSQHQSGPLWLEQGTHSSNPVWLSLSGNHVLAAEKDAVAKNEDGLTTYVDLVSIIIEERFDGLKEARKLAKKYHAEVVGMIAPLNIFQLRLPAQNLIERDALVLRLGSEISVDATIIEETAPEEGLDTHPAEGTPQEHKQSRRENATGKESAESEWTANRFFDAVDFYRRRIPATKQPIKTHPVRVGIIERNVDFDSPDFADYIGECRSSAQRTCLYAHDADCPTTHGTTVASVLAAAWNNGGSSGFLRGLDQIGPGFEIIVDRNSDAGITANIAAAVNLVEDGVRVLNWSWGIHRIGATTITGKEVDSLVRSGLAMSGYEELLEEFFLWLRAQHPDVVVVNSAGNGASFSGRDEYRLPSSFVTEQLLVVGGHERDPTQKVAVENPDFARPRRSSNIDMRVDISAAACTRGATGKRGTASTEAKEHCGTSYSTPLVTAVVAAMLSINPDLTPEQIRILLRRSAMTIGQYTDFEPMDADDLTAPILPSERNNQLEHPDVGRSARLDMHKALDLAVQSLYRVR